MMNESILDVVINTMRLLAADPEVQIAALPQDVAIPDEIALAYHEALLVVEQLLELGQINDAQADLIVALNGAFGRLESNSTGLSWELEGLRHLTDWAEIRSHARQFLLAGGWSAEPPGLGWIHYVAPTGSEESPE